MMDSHDHPGRRADDVGVEPCQSHATGDPVGTAFQSEANDDVIDNATDIVSNNEDISPSTHQLTEASARLLTVNNNRDEAFADGNSWSVPVRQNLVGNSASTGNREIVLMDNTARQGPVDGDHDDLSLHLPSHLCMSPSEGFDDDRDPNYATQRPDTLGAINAAAAVPVARPVYQVTAATRAWPVEFAAEDASFADDGTAHLGRRTCGAGMDQLELNQRQLLDDDVDDRSNNDDDDDDDDDDGSELCDDDDDDDDDDDTGLGSGNQCESTEADQYKMDPEADQSASAAEELLGTHRHLTVELAQNGNVLLTAGDARSGACACAQGITGAVVDVSRVMEDPEEDQADRAVTVDNSGVSHAALVSAPKPPDAANAAPTVSDTQKHGPLKQHPQSAFSIPKPRVTKSKPAESDWASCSTKPVPSVRQSKSKTDVEFKPINTCVGKSDSASRTVMHSKGYDGLNATGSARGELSQCSVDKKQLSAKDSRMLYQGKKDVDRDTKSDSHPSVKAAHDGNCVSSKRSIWSWDPLWNATDHSAVVWNDGYVSSSLSLPSACHLPGAGGSIAVGMFAPADSSSQQATPHKTDTRSSRMLDNSLDMSPIHPASSSSSRPLSVNGLHAIDSASVNDIVPSTQLYLDTRGPLPLYSHTVSCNLVLYDFCCR